MNSIYFKEKGEGPILVFLHGFCENHKIWEDITPELARDSKVITLDLPGFGKSPLLKSSFTIREVGNAVIEFLESKGIRKCLLVGHSLGGYVALAVAKERPGLLGGICLFHSTAEADSDEKKINRDRVIEFVKKNGVVPFVETFVPGLFFKKNPEIIEKVYKIALKTSKKAHLGYSQAMRDRPDMTGFIRVFPNPILFLAGEQDSIIPASSLFAQKKLTLNGQIIILPETGHMGMFEGADQVIQIIKDFTKACFPSVSV